MDFHPLNVVVDRDHAFVIDWTDAGLGPREVTMLHAGGFDGASSADAAKVPVDLIDFLRRRIDLALTA